MSAAAPNPFAIDRRQFRRNQDRAARTFDRNAMLQQEVCSRLLDRLDLVRLKPARILDAGCATGQAAAELARRYRRASISALDASEGMLAQVRCKQGWFRGFQRICGDLSALPLAGHSHQLLISSLALHWSPDLDRVFGEFARVLQPGGLLSFAMFGPDTLKELRESWSTADRHNHVNLFVDMHDVGDALIRAGFSDPVLDTEHITVHYERLEGLLADLKATGQTNVTAGRPRGLTGRTRHQALARAYEGFRQRDGLPATYEIVYGHAWAAQPTRRVTPEGDILIPVESLAVRRR